MPPSELEVSRRSLLVGSAISAAAAAVPGPGGQARGADGSPGPVPAVSALSLRVNGTWYDLELDNRTTLLDALREHLKLTGSKKGCDQGQCGACTVLVNGVRINSCLSLAVMHQRDSITTIEGLGTPKNPHRMQTAFVKHDGYQCGYCTPGQICSAIGALDEINAGVPSHASEDVAAQSSITAAEIRERMSGNLCRCGAYSNILDAILDVAGAEL